MFVFCVLCFAGGEKSTNNIVSYPEVPIIGVHSIVDGASNRNQKLLVVVVNAQHELTAIKPKWQQLVMTKWVTSSLQAD